MAIVTDLKRQKKNESRINVYLDGEYFTSADEVVLYKAGIKTGSEVETTVIAKLLKADDNQKAFDFALKYLTYRLRAKKEINSYLSQKGFDEGIIEETIEKLEHYGYVDDEKFANLYVQSQKHRYGKKKIEYNLRQFGVSEEIISKTCNSDDINALKKIAQKYRNLHKDCSEQKLASHLVSKGFEWDLVKSILKEETYD